MTWRFGSWRRGSGIEAFARGWFEGPTLGHASGRGESDGTCSRGVAAHRLDNLTVAHAGKGRIIQGIEEPGHGDRRGIIAGGLPCTRETGFGGLSDVHIPHRRSRRCRSTSCAATAWQVHTISTRSSCDDAVGATFGSVSGCRPLFASTCWRENKGVTRRPSRFGGGFWGPAPLRQWPLSRWARERRFDGYGCLLWTRCLGPAEPLSLEAKEGLSL